MQGKKEYWPQDKLESNVVLEFRAAVALKLIEHFAVIAAKTQGEDASGRAKLELQPADELVDRCFSIADAFTEKAEARGELKEPEPFEVRHKWIGTARKIQMNAEFARDTEKV